MEDVAGFCVVSERRLDHKFIRSYPSPRGGLVQSLSLPFGPGNLPPVRDSDDPPVVDLKKHGIGCDRELGGHLKSYRAA